MWFKKLLKPKNEGCMHCMGKRTAIAGNKGGRVLIDNRMIVLEIRKPDGSYWQEGFCWSHINYCPYCGRRLR